MTGCGFVVVGAGCEDVKRNVEEEKEDIVG